MADLRRLTLWQEMSTPHLIPLLTALAPKFDRVRLVTLGEIDPVRVSIGWDDNVPRSIERIHAPAAADRVAALRECTDPTDLNLLQGLKPVRWQWQVQRALVASRAPIVVMSELHWPGSSAIRRLALNVRETALASFWSRRALAVLAFGEQAAAHYVSRGFPAAKVHPFAYTPVLSDARAAAATPLEGPVIAVAAKLAPYKGIDVLVRALASIANRPWNLKVAGDGPMRAELERLTRALGISHRIEWLGWRPAHAIPQLFADAALTVLPSRFEGWGAVVNEALGVGTPAVVSRGAGAHCLIRSPVLGQAVAADDPAAMAAAISLQLDDPAARRREAIRVWSRKTISPEVAADYFMACLGGERPRTPWRAVEVEAD